MVASAWRRPGPGPNRATTRCTQRRSGPAESKTAPLGLQSRGPMRRRPVARPDGRKTSSRPWHTRAVASRATEIPHPTVDIAARSHPDDRGQENQRHAPTVAAPAVRTGLPSSPQEGASRRSALTLCPRDCEHPRRRWSRSRVGRRPGVELIAPAVPVAPEDAKARVRPRFSRDPTPARPGGTRGRWPKRSPCWQHRRAKAVVGGRSRRAPLASVAYPRRQRSPQSRSG